MSKARKNRRGLRVLPALAAGMLLAGRSVGQPTATGTAQLAEYQLTTGPQKMAGVQENASGLTYVPETGSVFAIANNPPRMFEFDADGNLRRTIDLAGFNDTEDLTYLGSNRFVVVEEKRRNLCLFDLAREAQSVDYASTEQIRVAQANGDNVGIEGVAYDPAGRRFFVVKEKQPRAIYEVQRGECARKKVSRPWNLEQKNFGCSDFSGVFFDVRTGHLLLLSDESKCVVETTTEGREIGRLSLKAGAAGLTADIPQPEGITRDAAGRLYICSEPDWLYVFSPKP